MEKKIEEDFFPEKESGKKIEEIKSALKKCEKEKNEYLDGWKRTKADFINYKKEEAERMERLITALKEKIILDFLPVLDNFYLAEKEIPEEERKEKNIKGLLQIKSQIKEIFKEAELEEIKSIGEKFDPYLHEAVEMIEGEGESGTITEDVQKGYKLKGEVVRPAKVKVLK